MNSDPSLGAPLNYFSEEEQALQDRFRDRRDRLCGPLVRICQHFGVNANLISGIGLLLLLPFGAGLWGLASEWGPPLAAVSLLLHVLLDGLDGPLARAGASDGPAGAFTDMFCDHCGFLIVAALLAGLGLLEGAWATVYTSTYTLAVIEVVALNLLRQPLRWVIRTKYPFYALVGLVLCGGPNVLTPAAGIFSVIHGLTAIVGFVAIRAALQSRAPADQHDNSQPISKGSE